MSSPLLFVRDGRTLPFVPVTAAALAAIAEHVPARRRAYARSLYMAVLELANEARADRVPVSRKALGERSGCSRELVSDLRPMLEAAGVVVVHERTHAGATLEHEWIAVEPEQHPPEDRAPMPARHDPRAAQAQERLEGDKPIGTRARARETSPEDLVPDDFPSELRPHARRVMAVLRDVAERRGARRVTARAVALTVATRPRKPLVTAAHDCAAWIEDHPEVACRDVLARYRRWLDKEPDLQGLERLDGNGMPTSVPAGRPAGVTPIRGRRARSQDWRSSAEAIMDVARRPRVAAELAGTVLRSEGFSAAAELVERVGLHEALGLARTEAQPPDGWAQAAGS